MGFEVFGSASQLRPDRDKEATQSDKDRAALYAADYGARNGLSADDVADILRMLDIHPGRTQ